MIVKKFDSYIAVRLDPGEEINESLLAVAKAQNITFGRISAIGATNDFSVGIFNEDTKAYDRYTFTGNHEITSLSGSLTTMNGEPYLHAHINCADKNGHIVGGHLFSAKISLTCEIIIDVIDGRVTRTPNPEIGINQWTF